MKQLAERIGQLKKEDIVLFVRFYVDENENVADFVGDCYSLEGTNSNGVPPLPSFRKSAQEEMMNAVRQFDVLVQTSSRLSHRERTALGARCELVQ